MPEEKRIFQGEAVSYIETTHPNAAVECDVYAFDNDVTRDLAIIEVGPRGTTPRQRVLLGEKTVEGYISGAGELRVNGVTYVFPNNSAAEIEVKIGDIMQWQAGEEGLVFYEICTPPYADGRFANMKEESILYE